jgi:putative CocE/NonD family hydrolase
MKTIGEPPAAPSRAISSLSLLERAGQGGPAPAPEPMPQPEQRLRLPMRDGARLDTNVWLPATLPAPAILLRTPYKESTMGFRRLGVLRYVDAGYAVVIQQIRGVGASEGHFAFSAPHERTDGFDSVEWIARQPWCTGAVGMDGSSYVAMTQIAAAAERPPHLRCIVPAVPSVDFFREVPYCGGVFSRQHTLNWLRLVQIDSLQDLTAGFSGTMPLLSQPEVLERMTMRPVAEAADGMLEGDYLAHYRDALAHPTFDAWWQARTMTADVLAGIGIPVLVVNGNFDLGIGALTLWRGLEGNAVAETERRLLIGPWDHGQCYAGGAESHGPYAFGAEAALDLGALRLAFFDRHLKGHAAEADTAARVRLFVTGANRWHDFDRYPPCEARAVAWYLASGGSANSARGDGRLRRQAPAEGSAFDRFVDDPGLPFVAAFAAAREPASFFDLRERERHHETLVYDSGPLAEPMTLLGEGGAELFVSVDAPDADLVLWLAEHRADGLTIRLAFGQLRLRYHAGFDAERLLVPGETVRVHIPLTYVAHQVPAGSSLRLLVGGSNFPWADPNPHTGESIADAVAMRSAVQTVFHDAAHPSRLSLPVLP